MLFVGRYCYILHLLNLQHQRPFNMVLPSFDIWRQGWLSNAPQVHLQIEQTQIPKLILLNLVPCLDHLHCHLGYVPPICLFTFFLTQSQSFLRQIPVQHTKHSKPWRSGQNSQNSWGRSQATYQPKLLRMPSISNVQFSDRFLKL